MKLVMLARARGIALALGCAMAVASGTARATSCPSWAPTEPRNGADDVPTNTLIWGYGQFGTVHLVGPDGEVPLEKRLLAVDTYYGTTTYSVLIPQESLPPNTHFTVAVELRGSDTVDRSRFTT